MHTYICLYREVCLSSQGSCLEDFVRGGFCPSPLLSEYIRNNRKLNITFNFRFYMYEIFCLKRDDMLLDPSPCHKLSHLLGPHPPSSVTYFMDGPMPGLPSIFLSYIRFV